MKEKLNISPEKKEQIDVASVAAEGLDASLDLASEKVSEVVAEAPSENISASVSGTSKASSSTSVVRKFFGGSDDKVLPSEKKQRVVVRKTLEKKVDTLLKKARGMEFSAQFSANKLEKILLEIRYLRSLLRKLLYETKVFVERLYREFVMGERVEMGAA